MSVHDASNKLNTLLRKFYQVEKHTRAEAKSLALKGLTTAEKEALIEPIMDDFLRTLDAEAQTNLLGRGRIRSGNTATLSERRSQVVRTSTVMFAESKDKSFVAQVATLRDVAKEPLWLGQGEWVSLGSATVEELDQGRTYSEKIARSHENTARKINEIQRLILKAAPGLDGEPTLDKTIAFCDEHGDQAESLLSNLDFLATAAA